MNSLLPVLAALWLCGRGGGKERPPPSPTSAPLWPTTISPPPLAAFTPMPQPPHAPEPAAPAPPTPSAETATPLATLLHTPPTPPTTHAAPSAPIPRHTRAAAKITTPHAAVHKAAAQQLAKMAPQLPWKGPPIGPQAIPARAAIAKPKPAPKTTLRQAVVADLQAIMIARGARITKDGLYGPKTAGAWSELAHKKGLPPQIKRVNSKIASVSSVTYDALAVPP